METSGFYSSAEWRALRDRVRARDDNRCTVGRLLGGRCSGVLHVHHIEPVDEHPELALDEDNCLTACASHHPRWEAVARALRLATGETLPRCPHRHVYATGRRECEERRRRALVERRLGRLAAA